MYQTTLNHIDFGSAIAFKHNTTNFSALLTSYDSCTPAFDKRTVSSSSPSKNKV